MHTCINGADSNKPTWWVNDGYGIPLCRVCEDCEGEKLSHYRPDIMSRYDADEDIDGDSAYPRLDDEDLYDIY